VYTARVWDPVAGTNCDLLDVEGHGLATVDCAFNHVSVFANSQQSSKADSVSVDFDDEARWKAMNTMKLRMVPRQSPTPPLLWVPLRARVLETELEQRLKTAIVAHRDSLSAPTLWDDGLAALFSQALAKYEAARRDPSVTTDLTLFSEGVKGRLGDGRTFKGFPLNVTHTSEARVLAAVLGSATGKAVVEAQHEETYLAVRVRVTLFPEGVMSVWVMLGARFRNRML